MNKLKTKSSVKKRLKKTASGQYKRAMSGKRHLLGHKSSKRKRRISKIEIVYPGIVHEMRKCLPYH